MANLLVFARSNQISADSGIPFMSLHQRWLVLEELQSIVLAAEIDNVNVMTIANMRSLGVTAIEAMCECGRQMVVDVRGLPGTIEVPALRHRLRCIECGDRPNDVRLNSGGGVLRFWRRLRPHCGAPIQWDGSGI
jgi:hypothetical protein